MKLLAGKQIKMFQKKDLVREKPSLFKNNTSTLFKCGIGLLSFIIVLSTGCKNSSCPVEANDLVFSANGVSFVMKFVEGGTFLMGDSNSDANNSERPLHNVTLKSYYIGETEVTQELWKAVMGSTIQEQRDKANPNWPIVGEGDDYPMYYINWFECQDFICELNRLTGKQFYLPTEAEWEFAARGGIHSKGYYYSGSNNLKSIAVFDKNSYCLGPSNILYGTHKVKSKKPNEIGVYDMSGNLFEWCNDWYDSDYYTVSPTIEPTGPEKGSSRVTRGGSWYAIKRFCRVSERFFYPPERRYYYFGFRLAISQ